MIKSSIVMVALLIVLISADDSPHQIDEPYEPEEPEHRGPTEIDDSAPPTMYEPREPTYSDEWETRREA
jgi:hypothetical protein